MKQSLLKLMALCPGRIDIEIDKHKIFGETAATVIERESIADHDGRMAELDTLIRVEALTTTKPMQPVVAYSYDIELAIKDCLKQIKKWKQPK